ncbi:MAG: protein translocase subunit SecD [Nevskia sp.]
MPQYPLWKTLTLIVVTLIGSLYALPNLYGEDLAVQISTTFGDALKPAFGDTVTRILSEQKLDTIGSKLEGKKWVARFPNSETQLRAQEGLKRDLGNNYVVALNLARKTPAWLSAIGAKPMTLGLDLQGGVHFLMEVDVADARKAAVERYINDIPAMLRKNDIRYASRRAVGDALVLEFADTATLDKAKSAIAREYRELALTVPPDAATPTLESRISDVEAKRIVDQAVEQNLITLRNRVNQFGVAEPIIQKQGADRIVIELPGVQDSGDIKERLGATATLEYRAVDESGDANAAATTGVIPPGDQLYYHRDTRRPYLLKREVIASGSQLTSAQPTVDQQSGTPAVSVSLDGNGAKKMLEFTSKSVGHPMAVVFKEVQYTDNINAEGVKLRERRDVAEIISVATIQGVFGSRFQTTGLSQREASNLAQLLKAGALAAPVAIVEERTVGPSLGAENIRKGTYAAVAGFIFVVTFMAVYYSLFGLFADVALLLNVVLIIAALSLFGATLTMPGIAGIVLTLGMAVDANVLINERIREELRLGYPPHQAMTLGYERAFLTIADSNVTTLIAALVLFTLGAGPVKGFAITLALGLGTSMFTSIIGTRTIAYYALRNRKLKDLPV